MGTLEIEETLACSFKMHSSLLISPLSASISRTFSFYTQTSVFRRLVARMHLCSLWTPDLTHISYVLWSVSPPAPRCVWCLSTQEKSSRTCVLTAFAEPSDALLWCRIQTQQLVLSQELVAVWMLKINEYLYSVVLKSELWFSIWRNIQPLYSFVTSRICFSKNTQSC